MKYSYIKVTLRGEDGEDYLTKILTVVTLLKSVLEKGKRVMYKTSKGMTIKEGEWGNFKPSLYDIRFIVALLDDYTENVYQDLGFDVGTIDLNREQRRQSYNRLRLKHIEDGKTNDIQYWIKATGHFGSSPREHYGKSQSYRNPKNESHPRNARR